jgi:hypothetical protein
MTLFTTTAVRILGPYISGFNSFTDLPIVSKINAFYILI